MNWAPWIWLILMVLFLCAEAATVTMISTWFAFGALAALITSLLGGQPWLQVTLFLAVSCALLAMLRPLTRKFLTPRLSKTNVDAVIGSTGIVTAAIDNDAAAGQVKLGAMYWSARSTSGDPISEGTRILVDRIEGVKVFVTPAEVPASV
jgi:membrane protein implicated in regulation of membrane protease activity